LKVLCRNCAFFDLEAAKSASGRVMSERAVRCLWTPRIAFPESVTSSYRGLRLDPRKMQANEGEDCPAFESRAK